MTAPQPVPVSVDRTLDCSGLACPLPIYKTTVALAALPPGAVLEVLSTDPASPADFRAYARQTGHELLAATQSGGTHAFVLRKRDG